MTLFTLTEAGEYRFDVERSRFIARAVRFTDPETAHHCVATLGEPDAKHVCFAWRVGLRYRFHDANEPVGTAGKPILAAIDGFPMDQVLVVVVRYFGGIKLGKGGLVRAYGHAASEVLKRAHSEPVMSMLKGEVRIAYECEDALRRLLGQCRGIMSDARYSAEGLRVAIEVPNNHVESFSSQLRDATRGGAVCKWEGQ